MNLLALCHVEEMPDKYLPRQTLLQLLAILISMIGSIITPSLIRKVYNTITGIISPSSLLKYSTACLVNCNSPIRCPVLSMLKFLDLCLSLSHTHTRTHPVGPLCTSNQLFTEAYTYTTQNKHKKRPTMPSAGFESMIPVIERQQTNALDRTATGIGV